MPGIRTTITLLFLLALALFESARAQSYDYRMREGERAVVGSIDSVTGFAGVTVARIRVERSLTADSGDVLFWCSRLAADRGRMDSLIGRRRLFFFLPYDITSADTLSARASRRSATLTHSIFIDPPGFSPWIDSLRDGAPVVRLVKDRWDPIPLHVLSGIDYVRVPTELLALFPTVSGSDPETGESIRLVSIDDLVLFFAEQ